MSGAAITLFSTSAVLGILGLLAYRSGDGARRFAFSVLLCLTVITSLVGALEEMRLDFPDTGGGISDAEEVFVTVSEAAFSDGVARAIADRFALSESDITVALDGFDFQTMTARCVRVTLRGAAAYADARGIKEYIENEKLGECVVKVELG